jgi:CDGSH-type Zn-finger protein
MADSKVTVRLNGPYIVEGPIELVDQDGNAFTVEGERFVLCRCGQSENKPFCDASHRNKITFDAPTKAS